MSKGAQTQLVEGKMAEALLPGEHPITGVLESEPDCVLGMERSSIVATNLRIIWRTSKNTCGLAFMREETVHYKDIVDISVGRTGEVVHLIVAGAIVLVSLLLCVGMLADRSFIAALVVLLLGLGLGAFTALRGVLEQLLDTGDRVTLDVCKQNRMVAMWPSRVLSGSPVVHDSHQLAARLPTEQIKQLVQAVMGHPLCTLYTDLRQSG